MAKAKTNRATESAETAGSRTKKHKNVNHVGVKLVEELKSFQTPDGKKKEIPYKKCIGKVKDFTFDYVWGVIKYNLRLDNLKDRTDINSLDKDKFCRDCRFYKALAKDIWRLHEDNRRTSQMEITA